MVRIIVPDMTTVIVGVNITQQEGVGMVEDVDVIIIIHHD